MRGELEGLIHGGGTQTLDFLGGLLSDVLRNF